MVSDCPLHASALRAPGQLALVDGARRLSFSEMDREVSQWVGRLHARGVGPGNRVVLLAWNCVAAVALLFAVRRVGATLVPLNARLTREELEPLLRRVAPRAAFAQAALADRLPDAECLERVEGEVAPPPVDVRPLAQEEDWAVLFTSGTTGRAKGARLPVRAFLASAAASRENLGRRPEDSWLCNLPLFHVGGLAMAVRCAVDSVTLVLHRRFEAEACAHALSSGAVTHVSLVARTLALTLEAGAGVGALRAVLLGGGPLPEELARRARAKGFPVLQTYGLTEACSQVATERPADADGTSAGPALPGLSVRLAPAEGGGEGVGEILVQGQTVMAGYFEDAEATERALAGGWLHTGDLGSLDARGRLRVVGRRFDLILSGGENVYPAEVEAVLAAHPHVAEAAVVGRLDGAWGEVPVAAVVLRPGGAVEGVREWARGRLAGFKVPASVVALEALPRTASEKVDRVALRRVFAASDIDEEALAGGKRDL